MEALEKLVEDYKSVQLAKSHLAQLKTRLTGEKGRLVKLATLLDKEYADVRKLEILSIRHLFAKLLGSLEEQYEIQKQEYLVAALQYKECKKMVDLLTFEAAIVEEKVKTEAALKKQLDKLIVERKALIVEKYPAVRKDLLALNLEVDKNVSFRKAIQEGLSIGIKIEEIFNKMIGLLIKAQKYDNWGSFYQEIQEGKKIKASYMDQVQNLSHIAKQCLQQLEDELADIHSYKTIMRISKFEEFQHFNDIYYDRLLSDWIIQQNVVSSLQSLTSARDSIKRIKRTLNIQLKQTEAAIITLRSQMEEIIVGVMVTR